MEYPNLQQQQQNWMFQTSTMQQIPSQKAHQIKTLPTNDVDKVRLLSHIILRESPLQQDLPLLPQLIERQKLLRHLISGPISSLPPTQPISSLGITSAVPVQTLPVVSRAPAAASSSPISVPLPSTSYSEAPIHSDRLRPESSSDVIIMSGRETPIDVVRVDSVSSGSSSEGSISRKRKLSSDNVSTSSMGELSTSPHLFEISEKHFTEVFSKQRFGDGDSPTMPPVTNDRPNTKLISMLNRCVSDMKAMLSQRGVPINVDDNGMPVDYSSRPIDEIFKQSRKQLDALRAFKDNGKH